MTGIAVAEVPAAAVGVAITSAVAVGLAEVPPGPAAPRLAACTVTLVQSAAVTGSMAVLVAAGEDAVADTGDVAVASGATVLWGFVATGGSVFIFTGLLLIAAEVEQAVSVTANAIRTPKNFGYFILSLLFQLCL